MFMFILCASNWNSEVDVSVVECRSSIVWVNLDVSQRNALVNIGGDPLCRFFFVFAFSQKYYSLVESIIRSIIIHSIM